jgi:hypothetical protein
MRWLETIERLEQLGIRELVAEAVRAEGLTMYQWATKSVPQERVERATARVDAALLAAVEVAR